MKDRTKKTSAAFIILALLSVFTATSRTADSEFMVIIVHEPDCSVYETMKQMNLILVSAHTDFAVAKIPVNRSADLEGCGLEYELVTLIDSTKRMYMVSSIERDFEFDPGVAGEVVYVCEPFALIVRDVQNAGPPVYPGMMAVPLPDAPIVYPCWSLASTPPVSPTYNFSVQTMVNQVSTTQMSINMNYLSVTLPTRYTYAPDCYSAVTHCYNYFNSLGLSTDYHVWSPAWPSNIVATKTGLVRPDEIVILMAHLDSSVFAPADPLVSAPGAEDNASGSVAVMESARILSGYDFENTIKFILFTGEEQGLFGSEAYAEDASFAGDDILAAINYDMVGWGGNSDPDPEDIELDYNFDSEWLANYFIQVSNMYGGVPAVKWLHLFMGSDHLSFWNEGYSSIHGITEIGTSRGGDPYYPYYHSVNDTPDKIDFDHLKLVAKAMVANGAHLAIPVMATETPTSTYRPTDSPTFKPTSTFTPTETRFPTYRYSPTNTPSPAATTTLTPIPTSTPYATYTPRPTYTYKPTSSPTVMKTPDAIPLTSSTTLLFMVFITGYLMIKRIRYNN